MRMQERILEVRMRGRGGGGGDEEEDAGEDWR